MFVTWLIAGALTGWGLLGVTLVSARAGTHYAVSWVLALLLFGALGGIGGILLGFLGSLAGFHTFWEGAILASLGGGLLVFVALEL